MVAVSYPGPLSSAPCSSSEGSLNSSTMPSAATDDYDLSHRPLHSLSPAHRSTALLRRCHLTGVFAPYSNTVLSFTLRPSLSWPDKPGMRAIADDGKGVESETDAPPSTPSRPVFPRARQTHKPALQRLEAIAG